MVLLPRHAPSFPDSEPVIPELLDYWEDELHRGQQDRLEVAEFLDLRLAEVALSRGVRDRHLGLLLEKLALIEGGIKLGFASVEDYAVERLGIGRRSAQALRQLARATWGAPTLAAAVDQAVITPRKALILSRVLRQASEEETQDWIARAAVETVRGLEQLVRLEVAPNDNDNEDGDEDRSGDETGVQEAPRRKRAIELSRATEARWRQAQKLHARLEGRNPRVDETLEAVAAEYLSGALPQEHEEAAEQVPQVGLESPRPAGPAPWCLESWIPAADRPFYEALAEEQTNRWAFLPEPALDPVDAAPDARCLPNDPFELDRRLRRLARQRWTRDRVMGRDVRLFMQLGLWREAGFISFGHYAKERLGLGVRSLQHHARLDRRLFGLPELDAAYTSGDLGFERARLVAEVASRRPARPGWPGLGRLPAPCSRPR